MKVAYFIGGLNRGGTEMLTLDICRKKNYAPYDMVLVYRNDGGLTEEFKATGVPMFRIKPKGLKLGYFFQLRALLKKERVDVIHAQTFVNSRIALIIKAFFKIKIVSSFHGFSFAASSYLNRRFVMKRSDELVFVSKYVQDYYLARNRFCDNNKCNVVHNGVSFEKLDVIHPKPDLFKGGDNTIKLGMVGSFIKERTQKVICEGLKLLMDQNVNNFEFYFVGRRVESESYCYDDCLNYCEMNNLKGRVHFVGERGDIPAILQYLDCFVYSSGRDTFGIAVVEALSCGLPVVVNDWDVMKEVTQQGKFAVLFESNNAEDCCMKMKELIVNLNFYKQRAQKNKELVREAYSIEKHIDMLSRVYNKCYHKE
jgi:glycosyltransferase involved in cell wall biosynthesis